MNAADEFKIALLNTAMEDVSGKPCLLCGGPSAGVATWFADDESSQKLGALPGKTRVSVYSLCESCWSSPDTRWRVEEMLLAKAECNAQTLDADWEIDGDMAHLPGRTIPDWVKDALADMSFPTPYEFIWREEPYPMVMVKLADGELRAVTPDYITDPADVPGPPKWFSDKPVTPVRDPKPRRPDPSKALKRYRKKKG